MKKRTTNIRQHYVPQFYLRNFTDDNGALYVYDIERNNFYVNAPENECFIKYFYDVDTDITKMFIEVGANHEQVVDETIRLLNEEVSSTILHYIARGNDSLENFRLSQEEWDNLFDFIILQMVRTPTYRQRLQYLDLSFCIKTGLTGEEGDEKIMNIIHNLLILGVVSRLRGVDLKLSEKYYIIFEHLIDEICCLKIQLANAGNILLVNRSNRKFICSSTPVNVRWKGNPLALMKALVTTFDDKKLIDIGDYLEFITIHLPISSDVAMFFFDRNYDKNLTAMSQGIGLIEKWNSDLLLNLNYSTMLKSPSKVYCSVNDYDEMIRMRNEKQNPRMAFRF